MNPRSVIHIVPLFRYSILFLIGIVLGDLLDESLFFRDWLLIGVCVTAFAIIMYKLNVVLCNIAILLGVVCFGCMRISWDNDSHAMIGADGTVECRIAILSEPIVRGKVIQFDAKVMEGGMRWENKKGKIVQTNIFDGKKLRISLLRDTITKNYKRVHIGEGLLTRIDLSPLKDWHRQNAHFDYIRWLKARGFVGRGFIGIGKWKKTDMTVADFGIYEYVRVRLLYAREIVLGELKESGMESESLAVASAMALGNKSALSPALRDEYTIAGAAHILALSGVHLSIIYMIISWFIGRVRKRQRLAVLVFVWAYVLFVGMPISVVRAACMLTIWDVLYMMERYQRQLNVFGMTLLLMIIASPESVWDVGFQMSFMAVLAIILFMEPINGLMPKKIRPQKKKFEKQLPKKERRKLGIMRTLWYITSASCSAQLGTAPLVAYYFGRVAVLFILTNLVVVPLSWMIICGTIGVACVAGLNYCLNGWLDVVIKAFGWCLSGVVRLQNMILTEIAHIPIASIDVNVNAIQVVAMYAIIGVLAVWVNRGVLKE